MVKAQKSSGVAARRLLSRVRNFVAWFRRLRLWQRITCIIAAAVLTAGIVVPVIQYIATENSYKLDARTTALIGKTPKNLASKLTYDAESKAWQFNKQGIPSDDSASPSSISSGNPANSEVLSALQAKVGGAGEKDESLYSVDMPEDGSKGVTYYDGNTDLSFSMVPKFKVHKGRGVSGQLVYPMSDGVKLIYTAKGNGMKEDIVLAHNIGSSLTFRYGLDLPDTLEAKVLEDGSVGIYSGDPMLFGAMSYGADADREKVASARLNAVKDHLLFAIPAPIIEQSGGGAARATAEFRLDGDELTVYARGMDKLTYPVTVDPSVVVTSTSDFMTGNSEGFIDYPANEVKRGNVTGGSLAAWSTTTSVPTDVRSKLATVAYNGYAYIVGGTVDGVPTNTVYYAAINSSNGTLGAWTATTSLPAAVHWHKAVIYNGYIYSLGGGPGPDVTTTVNYARVNSNGTLGGWAATSSLTQKRGGFGVAVSNGYVYALAGNKSGSGSDNGDYVASVEYAAFKADGTLGSWTTGTSLPNAQACGDAAIFNDFIYYIGTGSCSGGHYFAKLDSNGALGSWTTISNVAYGCDMCALEIWNGYLYVFGGWEQDNGGMSYTPIYANGTLGTGKSTSMLGTADKFVDLDAFIYNGRAYIPGGTVLYNGDVQTVYYANIDPAGVNTSYVTSANSFPTTRRGAKTLVFRSYLYVMGGDNGSTPVNTIYKAKLDPETGSIGSFTSTTAFTTARTFFAAVAYDRYMYVLGGCSSAYASCTTAGNNIATVYKSAVNVNDGSLGAWSAETSFTTGRYGLSAAAYNNNLYIMGGVNGSTFQNDIQYHAIGASGVISGAWSVSSHTISTARAYFGATISGGRLYISGGCSAGALTCTTSQNDIQHAPIGTSGDLSTALTVNGTSFSNTRGAHDMVIWAGYMYIIGGWNGATYYNDTQYAPIGTNGSVGTWASGTSFTNARYGHGAAAYGGVMYVAGGYNGTTYYNNVQSSQLNVAGRGANDGGIAGPDSTDHGNGSSMVAYNGYLHLTGGNQAGVLNTVSYAPINANGTIGTWTDDARTFNTPRFFHGSTTYNGYLYILGGVNINSTVYYSDVQYAPIGGSGALSGNFVSAGGSFAASGQQAPCVQSYNGYIYAAGGWNGSVDSNSVRYAAINANGTLGTWADSGNNFTNGRSNGGCFIANGKFYIVGGEGSSIFNDVQYATINVDGTLGSFSYTTGFHEGRRDMFVQYYNGFVYVGAGVGSVSKNDIQFAAVNANGTIGEWQQGEYFYTTMSGMGSSVYNGFIYTASGNGANGDTYAYSLLSIPRKARYSKLIDLNGANTLQSISYNGTLPGGLSNIKYRTAGPNGVFGQLTPANSLPGGAPAACSFDTTRYVWLQITLDDTLSAAGHTDVDSTRASVSDITVSYVSARVAPYQRLAHGKYFSGESLRSLDVCGIL